MKSQIQTNNTYKSFASAIDRAFSANISNPAVGFSHSRGWFVESSIHPRDEDCILRVNANYDATTGEYSIGGRSGAKNRKSWQRISEEYGI